MRGRTYQPSIRRPKRTAPEPPPAEERTHVMHVSDHALDRFREHEPAADRRDLLLEVAFGVGLTCEMAAALLGRPMRGPKDASGYVLSRGRRGLFVLDLAGDAVVTYLRFGPSQEDFVRRHWPADGGT